MPKCKRSSFEFVSDWPCGYGSYYGNPSLCTATNGLCGSNLKQPSRAAPGTGTSLQAVCRIYTRIHTPNFMKSISTREAHCSLLCLWRRCKEKSGPNFGMLWKGERVTVVQGSWLDLTPTQRRSVGGNRNMGDRNLCNMPAGASCVWGHAPDATASVPQDLQNISRYVKSYVSCFQFGGISSSFQRYRQKIIWSGLCQFAPITYLWEQLQQNQTKQHRYSCDGLQTLLVHMYDGPW